MWVLLQFIDEKKLQLMSSTWPLLCERKTVDVLSNPLFDLSKMPDRSVDTWLIFGRLSVSVGRHFRKKLNTKMSTKQSVCRWTDDDQGHSFQRLFQQEISKKAGQKLGMTDTRLINYRPSLKESNFAPKAVGIWLIVEI